MELLQEACFSSRSYSVLITFTLRSYSERLRWRTCYNLQIFPIVLIMLRVFMRIKDDCQKCTEIATKPNLIPLWWPKHSLTVISKLSNLFLPVIYSSFQWKPLCLQTRSQKVWHQFQKLQNFKWQFLSNLVRNLIILKIFSLKLFYLHQQEKK